MDPEGKGYVSGYCPYTYKIWCGSVHALLRYRSKTTKIQKFPIDSHSNQNFIFPFFRTGAANHQRGEGTSGTRVRPHGKFGVNRPAGCREIVDKKRTKNKQTYSKTNTSPFALTSEWRVTRALRERKLRQGRCIVVLW